MTTEAPDFFSHERAYDNRDVANKGAEAAAALRRMAQVTPIDAVMPVNEGMRSFLSPVQANTRFLAVKGKLVLAPYTGQSLGLQPAVRRDGDIWVEFSSGVCSTDVPEAIEWLEAHSGYPDLHAEYHKKHGETPRDCEAAIGLCREMGPGIDVWAELKAGQEPTANRAATISRDIDIDAFMRGDYGKGNRSYTSGTGHDMAETAKNNAAASQSKGREQ